MPPVLWFDVSLFTFLSLTLLGTTVWYALTSAGRFEKTKSSIASYLLLRFDGKVPVSLVSLSASSCTIG